MCVCRSSTNLPRQLLRGKAHKTHSGWVGGGQSLDDAAGNEGTLISPSLATDPEPNPRFSPSLVSFTLGLPVSEAPAVAHHSPASFFLFFVWRLCAGAETKLGLARPLCRHGLGRGRRKPGDFKLKK